MGGSHIICQVTWHTRQMLQQMINYLHLYVVFNSEKKIVGSKLVILVSFDHYVNSIWSGNIVTEMYKWVNSHYITNYAG